jgi:GT2 family glycosyltransferase
MIQSYYNYKPFEKTYNFFVVEQEEIIIKDPNINSFFNVEFEKRKVHYKCEYNYSNIDPEKPGAIICIKDNIKLLQFTFSKIKEHKANDHINILVVDDRPQNQLIEKFCLEQNINYVKVDNNSHFNFAMLNNIGANIFFNNGCQDIILWNSDLWPDNDYCIQNIINIHKNQKNAISGARLIYPTQSWDGRTDNPENITNFFKHIKEYRNTIQFGGSCFTFINGGYYPMHYARFTNNNYASLNRHVDFITGAFTLINCRIFFELGGLNPSLSSQFQDIDFSLRCRENKYNVFYIGEEYLLHDESVSLKDKDKDKSYISDNVLYHKLWIETKKINKLLMGEI